MWCTCPLCFNSATVKFISLRFVFHITTQKIYCCYRIATYRFDNESLGITSPYQNCSCKILLWNPQQIVCNYWIEESELLLTIKVGFPIELFHYLLQRALINQLIVTFFYFFRELL